MYWHYTFMDLLLGWYEGSSTGSSHISPRAYKNIWYCICISLLNLPLKWALIFQISFDQLLYNLISLLFYLITFDWYISCDRNKLKKMPWNLSVLLQTCVVRAWDIQRPLLFAPAMNTFMWDHPITSTQIDTLKTFGYKEIPCIKKKLACGDTGMYRW